MEIDSDTYRIKEPLLRNLLNEFRACINKLSKERLEEAELILEDSALSINGTEEETTLEKRGRGRPKIATKDNDNTKITDFIMKVRK